MDWPITGEPGRVFISPVSPQALGVEYAALAVAAPSSVAHGTANLARFFPFVLPETITVVKAWWYNGATANGNVDIGIYSEQGARIISKGNTAQGTINVLQEVDITDTVLGRGRYYCALSSSSATGTFFSNVISIELSKALGWGQMASANVLPATFTMASMTAAIQPIFGLSTRTLVV